MSQKNANKNAEEKEGTYEFALPHFDEKAFMRREVEGARVTFYVVGIALAAGILARVLEIAGAKLAPGGGWLIGWLPILIGLGALAPALRRIGFSAETTAPKAMFGNWFLMFFTALALWILVHNPPFPSF
ncbi:MAG: hypothetical protein ACYDCK_05680 [Thermoplasmatota archaeon]